MARPRCDTRFLVRGIQFGRGLAEAIGTKNMRVVAEAAFAARVLEDFAVPFAFGDDRLRVVGVSAPARDAEKWARGRSRAQVGEQFSLLRASDFGSPA
jgi:hypothetical protein